MLTMDFQHLTLPNKPNYYLVCPAKYCNVTPNQESPIFPVSQKILETAWNKMIASQPRVKLLSSSAEPLQYNYVQRSLVFHFPDYINVRFINISPQQSTVAIYSHAKYGYSDFGVNKTRIIAWLTALDTQLSLINKNRVKTHEL